MPKLFFDVPRKYAALENSRFVILPLPYEATTSYRKGAVVGPKALRRASAQVELFDEETGAQAHLDGIYTAPAVMFGDATGKRALKKIERAVSLYVEKGKFVASIGGEHTVTAGVIPVYAAKFKNLSVLHIDAHPDLRDSYEGTKYSHACVGRRILERAPIVQVGVRSWCDEQDRFMKRTSRRKFKGRPMLKVFPASKIHAKTRGLNPLPSLIDRIVNSLAPNVYLTLDLDGLDPSVIPAVGTPEPGGLMWQQTTCLLKKVVQKRNLVGMDMVELSHIRGQNAGDFAAARLLHKILSFISAKK